MLCKIYLLVQSYLNRRVLCFQSFFMCPALFIVYFSAVKNASERTEVRNAKDAIDAYKNITDAINAAEAAANEAKDAAEKSLNVSHRCNTLNTK